MTETVIKHRRLIAGRLATLREHLAAALDADDPVTARVEALAAAQVAVDLRQRLVPANSSSLAQKLAMLYEYLILSCSASQPERLRECHGLVVNLIEGLREARQ